MTMHFQSEGLVVRALPGGRGRGVFAARPFTRGSLLVVYGGVIISGAELEKFSPDENGREENRVQPLQS